MLIHRSSDCKHAAENYFTLDAAYGYMTDKQPAPSHVHRPPMLSNASAFQQGYYSVSHAYSRRADPPPTPNGKLILPRPPAPRGQPTQRVELTLIHLAGIIQLTRVFGL
jgi:hypothetical protein